MARPSRKARQQTPLDKITLPGGAAYEGELKFRPPEDSLERKYRLRKEAWSFWVKEALAYVVALLILSMTAVYCFWVLWHPAAPKEDRQWAMSILTSLVVGIVGYLFGKINK